MIAVSSRLFLFLNHIQILKSSFHFKVTSNIKKIFISIATLDSLEVKSLTLAQNYKHNISTTISMSYSNTFSNNKLEKVRIKVMDYKNYKLLHDMMRFKHNEANFEVTCKDHQYYLKIYFMNISGFSITIICDL